MLLTSALLLIASLAMPDDFQCTDIEGCDAINTAASGNVVTFRKGDIVSTERGFVVAGASGWVNIPHMDSIKKPSMVGMLSSIYECEAEECCATLNLEFWQKLKWTLKHGVVITADSPGWFPMPGQGWEQTFDGNVCAP